MALDARRFAKFILIGALAPLAACSDDAVTSSTGGSGGTSDSGAGRDVNATGGTGGTGGSNAGSGGTGGVRMEAGAGAAGGSTTEAGASTPDAGEAEDADAGFVCSTPQYSHVTTFASIFDGWIINNYTSPALAPRTDPDSGAMLGTQVAIDPAVGSPDPGSAKFTIPFNGPSQQLVISQNWAGLNMSGDTVSLQIRLDSGLNATPLFAGQAFLVVKTTAAFTYAAGPAINLDRSAGWQTLSISVDSPSPTLPPGHNPCDVREIDIIIQTPEGMVDAPDASTYTTAVVHLDTIAIGPTGSTEPRSDASVPETSVPEAGVSDVSIPLPDTGVRLDAASDATGQ